MPWRSFLTLVFPSLLMALPIQAAGPLNDTGIVTCGDASNNDLPCPVADYPGQDAEYGRDVTHNDPSDGHAGFSFTKLDANGNDLPASATDWSCVRDNVTGLIWEVKTDDRGLRDQNWTYTWYNSDPTTNGSDPGIEDGGTCFQAGRCDTEKYVADVNAQGLCGASDWRMPIVQELAGIVDYGKDFPAIENNYFVNTQNSHFWTASVLGLGLDYLSWLAWGVSFGDGDINYGGKDWQIPIRLVRGGRSDTAFIDHEDGTVTQAGSELMWAKCSLGQHETTCAGEAATMTWQEALQAASEAKLSGYDDWRLPSIKELLSLVDYGRSSIPVIDTSIFPNTPHNELQNKKQFWSGSQSIDNNDLAGSIAFGGGHAGGNLKTEYFHVRLVRGGQSDALSLSIAITGGGAVAGNNAQIACPDACFAAFAETTSVILKATPDSGWQFAGWGGACTGTTDCTLTVDGPLSVTANFTQASSRYQLDSPINASFESGIGVVHGWVCEAETIGLQVDDRTPFTAAYGAERADSQTVCGDTANGFAVAINWAEYGDGEHTLHLLADGQPLTQAQVTVTTLGVSYLTGRSATTTVSDFPATRLETALMWSEPHQNFMVGASAVPAVRAAVDSSATSEGNWESPLPGSVESGQALIRGWSCQATRVSVTLDGTPLAIPYGSEREDTRSACGDTNNGYALAINWNDVGDGPHTLTLNLDDSPVETRPFTIATPAGQGTVTGVQSRHSVQDFPNPGDSLTLQWSEPHQNFRLTGYTAARADTAWQVAQIYIATLGYAPDEEGVQYWVNNIAQGGWTPTTVAQSFFDQPAVQALYPADQDAETLIAALYQNIFGRTADAAGLAYWSRELAGGRVTRNQMIISLIEGGWANSEAATDMARFGHRVQVGLAFAAEQARRGIRYSQLTATQQAQLRQMGAEVLATVTADAATREAAIVSIPGRLDQL
jgi:hypothetical protein